MRTSVKQNTKRRKKIKKVVPFFRKKLYFSSVKKPPLRQQGVDAHDKAAEGNKRAKPFTDPCHLENYAPAAL